MLREEPAAGDLLAIAREVLLKDLLPALPPDKALAARMVANAMAQPVGWDASAKAYADLFNSMTTA